MVINGVVKLLTGPIGGVGQGGGVSPIIWLAILLILLTAYKKTNRGTEVRNIITGAVIVYWILSYVDDNTIVQHFEHDASINDILTQMKKILLEWNELLNITGGGLGLDKCKISIVKWTSGFWGQLRPEATRKGDTIVIHSELAGGPDDTLERIEPWDAERVLGLRLPMTGSMKFEYKYRKKQIDEMAEIMYQAPFTAHDAYIVYSVRYRAIIRYALPITTFTTTQLDEIQKKLFICSCLS